MLCSRFCAVTITGSNAVVSWATAADPAARHPIGMALAMSAKFFLCTAKLPVRYRGGGMITEGDAPLHIREGVRPLREYEGARPLRFLEARGHAGPDRQRRARRDVVVVVGVRVVVLVEEVLHIELHAQARRGSVVHARVHAGEL